MMQLGDAVQARLNQLGISPEALAQLGGVSEQRLAALSERIDINFETADPLSGNKYSGTVQDGRWNIGKPMGVLDPQASKQERGAYASGTYYEARPSGHPSAEDLFSALLDPETQAGAMFARGLQTNDQLRQRFEHQAALHVVPDGRADGMVSVSALTAPSGSGGLTGGGSSQTFFDLLNQMDQAIMEEASRLGGMMTAGSDMYGWTRASQPSQGVSGFSADGPFSGGDSYFGGGTPPVGSEATDSAQGVDEMTLEIKRLMDKRNQMYDITKSVFDKYNDAAKVAIQNMKA